MDEEIRPPTAWEDFWEATKKEYGVGPEENRAVMHEARERRGKVKDAPKMEGMLGSYRLAQVINVLRGAEDDEYAKARARKQIPILAANRAQKLGTLTGALGADLTQDSTRRFWWLLNAAQAVGEIGAEQSVKTVRPDLYSEKPTGKTFTDKFTGEQKPVMTRNYKPGYVQALAIPAGLAINTGLGLMTPFGGAEGYKAAIPSAEDPTKSDNILGEVALKYFMGRTGDLLPYDEFVKVRPDVSPEEYRRYKAFKFDKSEDWNPFDDGNISTLAGALRATDEGIHGPEVQFLGRSLPLTTGLLPYATAVGGTMLGASKLGPETPKSADFFTKLAGSNRPVRRGFVGGMVGLSAGHVIGNIIEAERRRRNTVENELDGTLR